jgi:thioredoxin reductase (NADPH)
MSSFQINSTETYEVVIVGGGPAGMSAGLWCAEIGIKAVVIESRAELGGQLLFIHNPISNYLGIQTKNGRELHDRFVQQFEKRDVAVRLRSDVERMDLAGRSLRTKGGDHFVFSYLVIATGVRRRSLGVEGEDVFLGKGILESGAKEQRLTDGKKVVIVGGGDAALENSLILSDHASKVIVVHRGNSFSARQQFMKEARTRANIELHTNSRVVAIRGNEKFDHVVVQGLNGEEKIEAEHLLIRIGVTPNSELFREHVECDAHGYIRVDPNCRTSEDRIYAVGDVASQISPSQRQPGWVRLLRNPYDDLQFCEQVKPNENLDFFTITFGRCLKSSRETANRADKILSLKTE